MKRTAFTVISLVVLFSTVVVSQLCSSANGNPNWRPWENPISYPILDVVSPVEGRWYSSNDVWLNFTLTKPSDWFSKPDCYVSYVTYCVDGSATGPYGHISDNSDENEVIIEVQDPRGVPNPPTSFSFSFDLEGLTDGKHTLEILVEGNYDWTGFGYTFPRTSFTVDTVPPQVSVLDLDNKTFSMPEVPLSFTVTETALKITYCLDGQENVTISGKETLTNLTYGNHNLTVFATDNAGNIGASETLFFTIVEPFPTSLVMASAIPVTVVLVGLGLLVYRIKRK